MTDKVYNLPGGKQIKLVETSTPGVFVPEVILGGNSNQNVSIADGDDVALGATTDVAVTSDVDGTLSAKLRGLVVILADVWDSTANLLRVVSQPSNGSLTDRSGTIAVGSTSQQLMAANASRKYLLIRNTSSAQLWINFTADAVQAQPSIPLESGESLVMEAGFISIEKVTIIGPSGAETFTAKEG